MPTRNFVPRATNEGSIGTSVKRWNLGYFNNTSYGLLSIVTASGSTALSITSPRNILLTGTNNQTLVLPDATTLPIGIRYEISNTSTGLVLVNSNGGTNLITLASGVSGTILLQDNSTASGIWILQDTPLLSLFNSSISTVSAAFAADTYLAGSNVQIPITGSWRQRTQYSCLFDMTKTNAGTASFTVQVRMGTTGTISDASIQTLTFGAGTNAADTGTFTVSVNFRTVGTGTTAIIQTVVKCDHLLAATGLTSTGAAGTAIVLGTSAGFNSTTQNFIGISVNGGAAFSGTNTLVQSSVFNI